MKKSKIFVVISAAALLTGLVLTAGCLTPVQSPKDENAEKISELETQVKNLTEELDKIKGGKVDEKLGVQENAAGAGAAAGATGADNAAENKSEENAPQTESASDKKSDLKVVEDHLEGETKATGYLVVKKENGLDESVSYDVAYFALTDASNVLTDWIRKMVSGGNTINAVDKYPMLGLGCNKDNQIDGTWAKTTGDDYAALKNSSEEKPVKVKLVFFDPPDTGGPCLTFMKSLTVIK